MADKRGFTLIEMVVTLAIIAILLGVAYPSIVVYRNNVRANEALRNEDIINKAVRQYYALEGSYPSASGVGCDTNYITIKVNGNDVRAFLIASGLDNLLGQLKDKAGAAINPSSWSYSDYKVYVYIDGNNKAQYVAVRAD